MRRGRTVTPRRWTLTALLPVLLAGCGGADQSPSPDPSLPPETGGDATPAVGVGQLFDRTFLFASLDADSTVFVPWLFQATTGEGAVQRTRSVTLGRGGQWELLVADADETPPTRTPWRILPSRNVRLTVEVGGAISGLIFRDPPRELETQVGELLTEWSGSGGEVVRLHRGTTTLPAVEATGFVVELSRSRESAVEALGDWMFLYAGERMQLFLEELAPIASPRSPARYRGWSRVAFRDGQWPIVSVEWEEMRPFERARQDIPMRWSISTPGEEIEGMLEVTSSHLMAGEGEGPLLPVAAFFGVRGTLRVEGEEFEVRGLIRHQQR